MFADTLIEAVADVMVKPAGAVKPAISALASVVGPYTCAAAVPMLDVIDPLFRINAIV